jgi:hypothetical protein
MKCFVTCLWNTRSFLSSYFIIRKDTDFLSVVYKIWEEDEESFFRVFRTAEALLQLVSSKYL